MNSATAATADLAASHGSSRPDLDRRNGPRTAFLFVGFLAFGLMISAYSLFIDVSETGQAMTTYLPFFLPGVALPIALGLGTMVGWKRIVVNVGERIGNPLMARVLTLPAANILSGSRYRLLSHLS